MKTTDALPPWIHRAVLISATVLALAGCGAMTAQNPSSALKPVNAV